MTLIFLSSLPDKPSTNHPATGHIIIAIISKIQGIVSMLMITHTIPASIWTSTSTKNGELINGTITSSQELTNGITKISMSWKGRLFLAAILLHIFRLIEQHNRRGTSQVRRNRNYLAQSIETKQGSQIWETQSLKEKNNISPYILTFILHRCIAIRMKSKMRSITLDLLCLSLIQTLIGKTNNPIIKPLLRRKLNKWFFRARVWKISLSTGSNPSLS